MPRSLKILLFVVCIGCSVVFIGATLRSFLSVERSPSPKLPTLRILTYQSFGNSLGAGTSLAKSFRKICRCKVEFVTTPEGRRADSEVEPQA